MARTVKPEEFAAKRSQILNAAQRLMLTKGYEQMSIQDILEAAQISSGAFHHYFESRGALLEAFIERIRQGLEEPLLPILRAADRSAIEKLQGFFDTLDQIRSAHQSEVLRLSRVWYTDDNAVVRDRVNKAVVAHRAPLLVEIVRQGIREGVFTTPYPEQSGEMILALLNSMGDAHIRLLLSATPGEDDTQRIRAVVEVHAAHMDAIERLLGAPANSLTRVSEEEARAWVEAAEMSA